MNDKLFTKKIFLFLIFILFSVLFFNLFFGIALSFVFDINVEDFVRKIQNKEVLSINYLKALKLNSFLNTLSVFLLPSLFYFVFFKKTYFLSIKRFEFNYRNLLLLLTICLLSLPVVSKLQQINMSIDLIGFFGEKINKASSSNEYIMNALLSTNSLKGLILNVFLLSLMPAVSEEFFFRGVLQSLLIKKTQKVIFSVFFIALIFAFFHMNFYNIIPIFYAGIILGFLYCWTSSIWVPVLFHFMFNLLNILMNFYQKKHNLNLEHLINNDSILYLIICLVGVFCLLFLFKKTNKDYSSFFVE